jgi:hypothetical protein
MRSCLRLRWRFESLVHAAIGEGPHLPALKCTSHWFLGLYLASVEVDEIMLWRLTGNNTSIHPGQPSVFRDTALSVWC